MGGKTIKSKLIQYNFWIICVISIFASTCSYVTANRKMVDISRNSLEYEVGNISSRYQFAYEEMLNIVLNCTERTTFNLSELEDYSNVKSRSRSIEYAKLINDFCAITGYGKYISKMSVFNDKGIIIQGGTSYGSSDDYKRITSTDWFTRELDKSIDYYQLEAVDSPFYLDNRQIIPIVRKLTNNDGWILLSVSTKLFQDVLNENSDGNEVVVVTNTGQKIASVGELSENKVENEKIIKMLLDKKENKGCLEMNVHSKRSLLCYNKDSISGILIYKIVSLNSIKNDELLLLQTIIIMFGACLGIGLTLSIIFTNKVKKPIDNLVKHIGVIAEGNFVKNNSIESEDEIGTIGKVINSMSEQINDLMEQRIDAEKEKSNLELKMLQAQINPHFLYNTLDSIKWIAIIQKNSGIVKVVTALSGLLKNMAKGFNEKVTLQKELDFLNDYVTIEKVRYVELFDLVINVEEEALYQAQIIKLTLQPLVENAIFSGIEPSGKSGLIEIHVFSENKELYIKVRDNGVGIPSDKLNNILKGCENINGNQMSGIGLSNVDKRIKLTYGNNYGLTIKSEIDNYTEITIKLPLEY